MNKPDLRIVDREKFNKVTSMEELNITVMSQNKRQLEGIASAIHASGVTATITSIEGVPEQLSIAVNQAAPDILIVDSAFEGRNDLESLERLGHLYPGMSTIVLCQHPSQEFLIQAMRAGVREVLPAPVKADALKAALERIRLKMGFSVNRKGKILAFISCKGGSGATLLAANLAYAIATQGKKVALFDLNLQFGDALLFLSDQKPPTTLSDVARGINRLDPAFLSSSMINVGTNLSVLAAPEDPAQAMDIKPEHVDALLKLARNQYDFVVLDVGRSLDANTIKALDHADMIFPVLQTTMPFIRDGKRLLDVFRTLDYPKSKVQLVVNRYQKGGDISLPDLVDALGNEILRTIPNHYEATAASVNQGIPIARLAKNSPVTKALAEWSESLTREPEQESVKWISRVFKRG